MLPSILKTLKTTNLSGSTNLWADNDGDNDNACWPIHNGDFFDANRRLRSFKI